MSHQQELCFENCQNRRLKDLEINFNPEGPSIVFLYIQDIRSISVELCLQDAQIALLHFMRLFTPLPPSSPLLPTQSSSSSCKECENINPSLSGAPASGNL